jgi:uncharacterized protein
VQRILPHPKIEADRGKVALQRGPVVYCLEQADHKVDVRKISLPDTAQLTTRYDPTLLGGVTVIEGSAQAVNPAAWEGKLYRPLAQASDSAVTLKAVPYCVWQNREVGPMVVWIARD